MPFANYKLPAGSISAKQKEQLVHDTTELIVSVYGEPARAHTMVLIDEVPDGGWGFADDVLTLAKLQQSQT